MNARDTGSTAARLCRSFWLRRASAGLSRESGQVIVLAALMMSVVMGAAALAIDVGSNDSVRGQLQGIADAAAASGARHLPETPTSGTCATVPSDPAGNAVCSLIATDLTNTGVAASATTTWSVPAGGTGVQVAVSAKAPSLFAGVFGINSTDVSASSAAVNNQVASGNASVLFAGDTTCSHTGISIHVNNATMTDNGAVIESNGALSVQLNTGTFGVTTYGGPSHCAASVGSTNNNSATFDGALAPTPDWTTHAFPLTYSTTSICSQPGAHNGTNLTITDGATGIWCATGTITGSGSSISSGSAGLTLIAPQINLSAGTFNLTPYYQGLLIDQTGANSTLTLGGNSVSLAGVIDVPTGTVSLTGATNSVNGFIEAQDISIQGILTLTGTGPALGSVSNNIDYTQ
jgi:hypothetical protein